MKATDKIKVLATNDVGYIREMAGVVAVVLLDGEDETRFYHTKELQVI
jgi:hypothetical protein